MKLDGWWFLKGDLGQSFLHRIWKTLKQRKICPFRYHKATKLSYPIFEKMIQIWCRQKWLLYAFLIHLDIMWTKVPIATKQASCYKVAQCSTHPTIFLKIWIEPTEFFAYLAFTWHTSIAPFCCTPKCKMSLRSSKKANLEIMFHQFPNKDDRKLQWLTNIGMTPNEFRLYWNLCCLHFKKSDYDRDNKLIPTSAPSAVKVKIILRETLLKVIPKFTYHAKICNFIMYI